MFAFSGPNVWANLQFSERPGEGARQHALLICSSRPCGSTGGGWALWNAASETWNDKTVRFFKCVFILHPNELTIFLRGWNDQIRARPPKCRQDGCLHPTKVGVEWTNFGSNKEKRGEGIIQLEDPPRGMQARPTNQKIQVLELESTSGGWVPPMGRQTRKAAKDWRVWKLCIATTWWFFQQNFGVPY